MIFITGDTHGADRARDRFNNHMNFIDKKSEEFKIRQPDSNDHIIILGDFGGVFYNDMEENYHLDMLSEELKCPLLFIDGNHENFNALRKYPIDVYNGAEVRKIRDNILWLRRGTILTLENKKFFIMGGASSHDKEHREPFISWWPEENISSDDYDIALLNLKRNNYTVDYVLSHCAPKKFASKALWKTYQPILGLDTDMNVKILTEIEKHLDYKKWYFGHYHTDFEEENFGCLYNSIIML